MELWVPIVLFLVIGSVSCTYFYLRYRARQEIQQTVRLAMEQGKELTPEMLEALSADVTPRGQADLRRGVVSLALAAALGLSAWSLDELDLLAFAGFPLMLGLAYLGLWRFSSGRPA